MLRVTLIALVFLLSACGGPISEYEPVHQYDPERDASRDIDAAVVEATRTGKRVLLEVGGEWCVWCHILDAFWEEHADVAEFLEANYVMVKVNFSPENENEAVLSRYPEIPGYPHFFVLNSDGSLVHSQGTGELEEGDHHDRDQVMAFLQEWAPAR